MDLGNLSRLSGGRSPIICSSPSENTLGGSEGIEAPRALVNREAGEIAPGPTGRDP